VGRGAEFPILKFGDNVSNFPAKIGPMRSDSPNHIRGHISASIFDEACTCRKDHPKPWLYSIHQYCLALCVIHSTIPAIHMQFSMQEAIQAISGLLDASRNLFLDFV